MIESLNQRLVDSCCNFRKWVGCKLLDSGEEVVGDYVFERSVKSLLSLSLLDGLFSFIAPVSLIFSYLANVRDIPKD